MTYLINLIAPPTIIEDPVSNQDLASGQILNLRCVAIGVPPPIITWTWDGGDLPEYVQMTSINGVGTLTIRNTSESNSGRYTCYAINKVSTVNVISPSAAVVVTGNV